MIKIEISRILHNSFTIAWGNSGSQDFSVITDFQLIEYTERSLYNNIAVVGKGQVILCPLVREKLGSFSIDNMNTGSKYLQITDHKFIMTELSVSNMKIFIIVLQNSILIKKCQAGLNS